MGRRLEKPTPNVYRLQMHFPTFSPHLVDSFGLFDTEHTMMARGRATTQDLQLLALNIIIYPSVFWLCFDLGMYVYVRTRRFTFLALTNRWILFWRA